MILNPTVQIVSAVMMIEVSFIFSSKLTFRRDLSVRGYDYDGLGTHLFVKVP